VPTAFYRHFDSMEALGLALVDEALRALRQPLREARSQLQPTEMTIRQSIHILAAHIHSQKPLFRFISRERQGGMAVIRQAIRQELRLFVSELALDLSRLSVFNHWSSQDLQMMASLTVNAMVSITEQISDLSSPQPELEREILGLAEKQLRLIFLGVPHWRSGKTSPKASNAA
jgi:AcrR family transcriptional regulator